MKLLLTLLSAYIALSNAAPVTVTETVVVRTQYSTSTVSGPPFTSAGEVVSTSTGAPVSSSAAAPSSESTSTSAPVAATTSATTSATTTSSSAAPSSSSTTSSSLNSFEAAILEEHNVKRALHGADPLTWDSTLAQFAADYSAKTFSCDNVELVHSSGPYGENLAYMTTLGGVAPVDAWYDEISQYDYSNPGFSMATGHFTQLIWASTTKVGCAALMCNNAQYTTCEYSSAGNVIGYFPENVYPLKG